MKNFVFDLYGTLADIHTDEKNPKFIRRMEKSFGADFFARYYALCKSLDTGGYCEIDLFKVFLNLAPDNAEKAAMYFRAKSRQSFRAYKGAHRLLKSLKKAGAKLYILSNAQACFTRPELEKLKFPRYFNGIELSSDFGQKKPSAEFFGHIVKKYSLEKSETIYIGNDFCADILGAKAAGLKTAYIKSNRSPSSDSLERARGAADFATDDFEKLSEFLISLV
ncbi:MAG: HAD family hydrolase [Clostridia bacterium]|nr:HAD family hydrolase [Clostridia bacterium]